VQNKVTVTIAGQEYTIMAAENAGYMKKVAAHVDEKVNEVLQGSSRVSLTAAAVLAALNVADEYFKEQDNLKALRVQLKEYVEESNKLKNQLSEAKREIFRLQNQMEGRVRGKKAEKTSRVERLREEKEPLEDSPDAAVSAAVQDA